MLISSWNVLIGVVVQSLIHVQLFVTHGPQHARLPSPPLSPTVYSNSCPLSWGCHPTISSSVVPFSSCLQYFPASGSFQMSQVFTSDNQNLILHKISREKLKLKRSNPFIASKMKEIMLKIKLFLWCSKLQYFGYLMGRADSFENTLMLGKI